MENETKILDILERLEQDITELKQGQAKLEQGQAKFETRFDKLETRFDKLETRFDKLEARVEDIHNSVAKIEIEQKQKFGALFDGQKQHDGMLKQILSENQTLSYILDEHDSRLKVLETV